MGASKIIIPQSKIVIFTQFHHQRMRDHERHQLEQKKVRLQKSIEKLRQTKEDKCEALKHEKTILRAKLEKISLLNAKLADRLGGVRTEIPIQERLEGENA